MKHLMKLLFIFWVSSLIFLITSLLWIINLKYIDQNEEFSSKYSMYESYSKKFSSDSIILNISEDCKLSDNPVKCVHYLINEPYDYERVGGGESFFRNPSDYFKFGGVCRDISLLRHSALSNLGVYCIFDFSETNHVFLLCNYKGATYKLNNEDFYIITG